jgi:hypothetical protein
MGQATYDYSSGYENEIIKEKESSESILTLKMVKDHLIIDVDFVQDDSLLLRVMESARSIAEDDIGIDLVSTKNTLEFIDFNSSCWEISESPFVSMVSLTATVDGINTDLIENTDYTVVKKKSFFAIRFFENKVYDKLIAVFNTGYNLDTLPKTIQQALLVLVADLYDVERTSTTSGLNYVDNKTYERLIKHHIVFRK